MSPSIPLQTAAFADAFVDVTALNAHVSRRLAERVRDVRDAARRGVRTPARAFAILGAAGSGKTHVFARLRHDPELSATMVLLRPFFGVGISPRDVLAALVDQLCLAAPGSDAPQLDRLAAHWLGAPGANLAEPAPDGVAAPDEADRAARLTGALERVVGALPEIAAATHLVRALLTVPSLAGPARWAELAWLSGREPRGQEAAPLSEADVGHLLRVLAALAAPVAPLVLTFDQLENLAGDADDARVLAYGNLVAELVDTVPDLSLAQLALTSEWMQHIEPRLTLPQRTRVSSDVLTLQPPDRDEREALLRAWHAQLALPNARGGKRRFPSPLAPDDLDHLLDAPGMTPRLLLGALSRAAAGLPALAPAAPAPAGRASAATAWDEEHARTTSELAERARSGASVDAAALAEGLALALSPLPSLSVTTRTERERVLTEVRSPQGAATLLYLTSTHHRGVGAGLGRAIELAQQGKTVIVRERRLELPATWEAVQERCAAFERLPNARWLWLEPEDVAMILTRARVVSLARAGRLRAAGSEQAVGEDELVSWLREHGAELRPTATLLGWLSDVPRERPAEPPPPRDPPPRAPPPRAPAAPLDTTGGPKAEVPPRAAPSTLGEWLLVGGELGLAALRRAAERVRARRR